VCVNAVEMFASCVLIFIVAALYEGLKVARDSLLRKASSGPCNGDAVAVPTTDIPMVDTVKLPSRCVGQVIFSYLIHDIDIQYLHYVRLIFG